MTTEKAMKTMYPIQLFLCLGILCNLAVSQGIVTAEDSITRIPGNVKSPTYKVIDLFASEEPLEMILSFSFKEFLKSRNDPQYLDATLTVKVDENDSITQPIKIKARGEMRRFYCSFPPIMLRFKKDDPDTGRIIQRKGTVKLVIPCSPNAASEGYVFKEYLLYKLYNQVTPYSFRTRLVRISLTDLNQPDKSFASYGFIIENEDSMSERNNTVVLKSMNLTQKNMVSREMIRLAVFNYMIGNTDWAVPTQHNVRIVKSLETVSDQAIPVAYDFDYAGFVSTNYATPAEELPIKMVSQRYYLGMCAPDDELTDVIDEFGTLKGPFLNTINRFELLPDKSKKDAEAYINSFYKMYKNQNSLIKTMNTTCKRL